MARATGQQVGKRQVEELTARAAVDFDGFYATRQPPPAADPGDVLVLSCDGKGVVMRADALRPATAAAAGKATSKLASRLSKGEKRNRKRMAEVGAVYDASPAPHTSPDILPANQDLTRTRRTRPGHQQQVADRRVVDDAAQVVAQIFDEAERRDPDHARTWIALVDGNNHQIERITAEAATRKIPVGDHDRLHPRAGVPVEGSLVLLRRGRPRRRGMGPGQGKSDPGR